MRERNQVIARWLRMTDRRLVECGCCGYYHRWDWYGDCRDDSECFSWDVADELCRIGGEVTELEGVEWDGPAFPPDDWKPRQVTA